MKHIHTYKSKSNLSLLFIFIYLVLDRDINLYLNKNELFSTIIMQLSRIAVVVLPLIILSKNTKNNYNKVFYCLLIYIGVSFVSSLAGGSLRIWLPRIIPLLGITAFISFCATSYSKYRCFINSVSMFYFILISINLFLGVFYPSTFGEGEGGKRYLIGYQNGVGFPLLIGFVFNYLNSIYNNKRSLYFLYVFFHIVTLVLASSATSIIAFLLIIFMLYFPAISKFFQKFSITGYLIIYMCISYCVIFLIGLNSFNISWLEKLLNDYFSKDLSFSQRTLIWEVVLKKIVANPIWGYGISEYSSFEVIKNGVYVVNISHNQLIQCLYEGGIVSLIVVLMTIWYILWSVKNNNHKELETFFYVAIMGLLVMLMMETVGFQSLYIILSLAYISLKFYPTPLFNKQIYSSSLTRLLSRI